MTENPFKAVGLATGDKQERRAFTIEELKALLAACNPDWRTMLLLGLYAGNGWATWLPSLGDRLTWSVGR